jgi:hypothetical protein
MGGWSGHAPPRSPLVRVDGLGGATLLPLLVQLYELEFNSVGLKFSPADLGQRDRSLRLLALKQALYAARCRISHSPILRGLDFDSMENALTSTPSGLSFQPIRDRPDLLKQAVEHALGVGVDAPFGQAALGVEAGQALLQGGGADF